MTPSERGRKGGQKIAEQYGHAYMRQIGSNGGKKGIIGLAASKFGGSVKDAMAWVRSHAIDNQVEALTDIRMNAELAKGKDIVCEEMSVLETYEPADPKHWQELVKASRRGTSIDLPW